MFSFCLFISLLGVGASARAVQVDNRNASSASTPTRLDTACHVAATIPSIPAGHAEIDAIARSQTYLPSASTDDHTPVKLQSASSTAQHGGAVTSLAITRSGVPTEPQSSPLFAVLPSAPAAGVRSEGSANVTFGHASVLSSQLAASTSDSPPAATLATTQLTTRPGHLAAINNNNNNHNEPHPEPTLDTPRASTRPMSEPRTTEAPQDALSVLLSALPVDVASSIEAGFSVVTHELFATSGADTSAPTSRPTPTDRSREPILSTSRSEPRPTSGHPERPTSETRTSRPTSHPTIPRPSSHTSRPTSHPSSSPTERPTTTFTTRISTTSTPPPSTTSTSTSTSTTPTSTTTTAAENSQPTITPERQQANGTIAGVATGAAAGIVLLTLAIFFLLRRRQRKRALQAVAAKSAYPESAWLYDPQRSPPPRSLSPAPPQIGAVGELGMTQAQAQRSSLLAPEVVMPEGEPLLAPGRVATRDNSPNGGGVRSASPHAGARGL